MPPTEGSMRERIRQVALELFTERGYDGTSLREIAEQLGVTKAALYYHFKSKEAILLSLMAEMKESVDALVEWGIEQPFSAEFQFELLERLADLFYGDASRILRLLQENQPVIRSLHAAEAAAQGEREDFGPKLWIFALLGLLTPPDADLYTRTRIRAAMMAIVFRPMGGPNFGTDLDASLEEQKKVSLEVAYELLGTERHR
ncbi:TetR/AcrR family transcriptional regulator [Antrihabitans cavernicola]|uniref:TetR/AcrR family transcriptional regulator n=1 Tax=Antrihabitans cavernicola TaxID=2495913 RepID=A0A5A7S401_9NOCA|nr:TetR/AcrR family transcriptional regulator [Spelaeibacter cavernicola]KAA0018904.1 TetR/AcrR family transcriptional regulator [Spelaeibacter cavernicola]